MSDDRAGTLLGILQDHFTPREEGWLWVALYADDAESGVVSQLEGDYDDPVQMGHGLARIIGGASADRAYLALCRSEGRPTEADRQLWRLLRQEACDDKVLDMVIFNRDDTWSMRAEDAAAAAAVRGSPAG